MIIGITCLDRDANIAPWYALEERGVIVRLVDINLEDWTLNLGILYGKRHYLQQLNPYKVRPPASEAVPQRGETGTQNHEALAGLVSTINYLAQLGYRIFPSAPNRRAALLAAMRAIAEYEQELCQVPIDSLLQIRDLHLYGIRESSRFANRTPTVAIRLPGHPPHQLAKQLGERVFCLERQLLCSQSYRTLKS